MRDHFMSLKVSLGRQKVGAQLRAANSQHRRTPLPLFDARRCI